MPKAVWAEEVKEEIIFCSLVKADFVSLITHMCISSSHNINFILLLQQQ